jgi:hypothetical protein
VKELQPDYKSEEEEKQETEQEEKPKTRTSNRKRKHPSRMTYAKPSQKGEKKTWAMSKSCTSRFSSNSWSIQLCWFPVFGRKNQRNATLSWQLYYHGFKKNTPPQVELSDKTIESSKDERNESKQHTSVVQDFSEKQPDSQNIPDQLNNQPNNELPEETSTDKLEEALTQHSDKGNEQSECQFNNLPNEQSKKN